MTALAEWESCYVIVGGGAAALIGLQFVVLTLIAQNPHLGAPEAGDAFATPTIVHFGTALLLAALVRVLGRASPVRRYCGASLGSLEQRMHWLLPAARTRRQHTARSSRTGSSTLCCRWPHTQRSFSAMDSPPLIPA
jgi:hypothetical protein